MNVSFDGLTTQNMNTHQNIPEHVHNAMQEVLSVTSCVHNHGHLLDDVEDPCHWLTMVDTDL